jgi:hypothetical protein
MAQQARPKVTGHSDDNRLQFTIWSSVVIIVLAPGIILNPSSICRICGEVASSVTIYANLLVC